MIKDSFGENLSEFLWHGGAFELKHARFSRIRDHSAPLVRWKLESHCACLDLGLSDFNPDGFVFIRLHEIAT